MFSMYVGGGTYTTMLTHSYNWCHYYGNMVFIVVQKSLQCTLKHVITYMQSLQGSAINISKNMQLWNYMPFFLIKKIHIHLLSETHNIMFMFVNLLFINCSSSLSSIHKHKITIVKLTCSSTRCYASVDIAY